MRRLEIAQALVNRPKVLFLDELPQRLSRTDCLVIETLFDVRHTHNSEILVPWFCIAAASSYENAFPAIHEFLGIYGRGKFLRPLYRALHQNVTTRDLARQWFGEFAERYHSVGRNAVARILEKA